MRYVEINDTFVAPLGKEFDFTIYPGPGLYATPDTNKLILAYQSDPKYPGCVMIICTLDVLVKDVGLVEGVSLRTLNQSGISENTLLKALAIVQNPDLAKDLI